jgi:hypothetical protein
MNKKTRGRKSRQRLKIQPTLYAAEMQAYENNGSDPLYIRYVIRVTEKLCLHPVISEQNSIMTCYICGEKNPETFAKFLKNLENTEGVSKIKKSKSNIVK